MGDTIIRRRLNAAAALLSSFSLLVGISHSGCARDFDVPSDNKVLIKSFTPTSGWAGTHVALTGVNLGARPSDVQIRFGQGLPVTPLSLISDGGTTTVDVVVPDDVGSAADAGARISVVSPTGTAISNDPFVFRGLGRLRNGVIAAQRDLRPDVATAIPLGPAGDALLFVPSYSWAGVVTRLGEFTPVLDEHSTIAVAATDLGALIVSTDVSSCASGSAATLKQVVAGAIDGWLPDAGLPISSIEMLPPVCLPAIPSTRLLDQQHIAIAADPASSAVIVVSDQQLWTVDLTAPTPVVEVQPVSFGYPLTAAFVAEHRFIVSSGWSDDDPSVTPSLRYFDVSTQTLGEPLQVDGWLVDPVRALAVSPDGRRLALAYLRNAFVQMFKIDGDAIASASPMTATQGIAATSIAFSDNSQQLAVATTGADGVELFQITGSPVGLVLTPHGLTPIPSANSVRAVKHLFAVGTLGESVFLTQDTGAVTGQVKFSLGLCAPQLRLLPNSSLTGGQLLLGAQTVNRVIQVGEELREDFHGGVLDPGSLESIAATPDGRVLYSLHQTVDGGGFEVRRTQDTLGGTSDSSSDSWPLPPEAGDGVPQFSLSTDGGLLNVAYETSAGWSVSSLDTSVVWSASLLPRKRSYTDPSTDPSFQTVALLSDETGLEGITFQSEVELFDSAAMLSGAAAKAASPLPAPFISAAAAQGTAYILGHGDSGRIYLALVRGDGATTRLIYLDKATANAALSMSVPAAGTRVYLLRPTFSGQELVRIAIDPVTGALGPAEPSVALPAGVSELVLSADGSRLYAIDTKEDQVLLIE